MNTQNDDWLAEIMGEPVSEVNSLKKEISKLKEIIESKNTEIRTLNCIIWELRNAKVDVVKEYPSHRYVEDDDRCCQCFRCG